MERVNNLSSGDIGGPKDIDISQCIDDVFAQQSCNGDDSVSVASGQDTTCTGTTAACSGTTAADPAPCTDTAPCTETVPCADMALTEAGGQFVLLTMAATSGCPVAAQAGDVRSCTIVETTESGLGALLMAAASDWVAEEFGRKYFRVFSTEQPLENGYYYARISGRTAHIDLITVRTTNSWVWSGTETVSTPVASVLAVPIAPRQKPDAASYAKLSKYRARIAELERDISILERELASSRGDAIPITIRKVTTIYSKTPEQDKVIESIRNFKFSSLRRASPNAHKLAAPKLSSNERQREFGRRMRECDPEAPRADLPRGAYSTSAPVDIPSKK